MNIGDYADIQFIGDDKIYRYSITEINPKEVIIAQMDDKTQLLHLIEKDDNSFKIDGYTKPHTVNFTKNINSIKRSIDQNLIQGMLAGLMLGDALGHPHEFKYNKTLPYTGKLHHRPRSTSRFQGERYSVIGQVTDDTEMTLALVDSLIRNKAYNRNDVILSYENWANSNPGGMGTNTRLLFHGVKTIKGYETRYQNALNGTLKGMKSANLTLVQSNGSLMRCCPLALLEGFDAVIADVNLTNPNLVNQDCGILYIAAIKMAFAKDTPITIFNFLKQNAQTPEVKAILNKIEMRSIVDITGKDKGWVIYAFYCAISTLLDFHLYQDFHTAIDRVINLGGDTDTNGAITGALLGAYLGFNNMLTDKITQDNIAIILKADTTQGDFPRPALYSPSQLYQLSEKLYNTLLKKT